MAKIYAPPTELPVPVFNPETWKKDETEWLQKLKEFCQKHGQGALAGETIREPRGDGYAIYMVFSEKPLSLVHIPLRDAWSAGAIWERGINLTDVRRMVEREKAIAKLFSQKRG